MKKLIILSIIAFAFTSCKNNEESKVSAEETETVIAEQPASLLQTGCYSYNAGNNAINFEVTGLGDEITGTLIYALDGKDTNTGTFKGQLSDDKLFGIYTFMSEGVESTREVAFMVKDDQLIEGYGELNESGNAFTDKNDISYNSAMPLTKTDCDT